MKQLNNKELLELLKKDVKSFNDYRVKFPEQEIDFSGADLDKEWANLKGLIITGANLDGINFEGRF